MTDQTTPTLDEAVARMNAGMAALRVALDALLPLTERCAAPEPEAPALRSELASQRAEVVRLTTDLGKARQELAEAHEAADRWANAAQDDAAAAQRLRARIAELEAERDEALAQVARAERSRIAIGRDRDRWRQAYEATGAPGGAAAVEQLRAQLAEAREKYEALARPVRQPVPAGVLDWARDEARACGGPGILGYDAAVEGTRRRVIGELWCRWDDAPGVYPGQAMVWLQEVSDAMHEVVADARRAAEPEPARSDLDDFPVGYTIGCAVPGCRVEWTVARVADGSWRADADADPRKMVSATPGPGYPDPVAAGLAARSRAVTVHASGLCACEPGASHRGATWSVALAPDGKWAVRVNDAPLARVEGLDAALETARARAAEARP